MTTTPASVRTVIDDERLRLKRYRVLGTDDPFCDMCGERSWRCLYRPRYALNNIFCENCAIKFDPRWLKLGLLLRMRKAAIRRLTQRSRCVTCGESDWRVLVRSHIPGEASLETWIIQCRNCHRKSDPHHSDPRASVIESPREVLGRYFVHRARLDETFFEHYNARYDLNTPHQ